MDRFRAGELDVLVATTVIEVGVDVAQRDGDGGARRRPVRDRPAPPAPRPGRAGRARRRACWLVTQPSPTTGASPRVEALVRHDRRLRAGRGRPRAAGRGHVMSTLQKGRSDLKLASLRRDRELVAAGARGRVRDRRRRPDPRRPPRARRRARAALHRTRRSVPHQVLKRPETHRSVCFRCPGLRFGADRSGLWSSSSGARGGRGPSGRGSPRSGRRRCRRATTRRPRGGVRQQEGAPAAVDARDHGSGSSTRQ